MILLILSSNKREALFSKRKTKSTSFNRIENKKKNEGDIAKKHYMK